MYIVVTQEDIERGRQASAHECPVSLAASRTLGQQAGVCGCCGVGLNGGQISPLSKRTIGIIRRYDATGEMDPFVFRIRDPRKG
jgi:hypothetical protein